MNHQIARWQEVRREKSIVRFGVGRGDRDGRSVRWTRNRLLSPKAGGG